MLFGGIMRSILVRSWSMPCVMQASNIFEGNSNVFSPQKISYTYTYIFFIRAYFVAIDAAVFGLRCRYTAVKDSEYLSSSSFPLQSTLFCMSPALFVVLVSAFLLWPASTRPHSLVFFLSAFPICVFFSVNPLNYKLSSQCAGQSIEY